MINEDLCARVQTLQLSNIEQSSRVGLLQTPKTMLTISINHQTALEMSQKPSTSLPELLNSTGRHQDTLTEPLPVPHYKRLMLAKLLSKSVLLFHNSKWLIRSFSGKDIRFRDPAPETGWTPSTGMMYVKTLFGTHVDTDVSQPPSARQLVPNPYLFGLGVMLLELGFGNSFERLRTPEDEHHANGTPGYLEFFIAKRLCSVASETLGSKYASIVKRCLQCDFGFGDDLTIAALQEAVYRQVYCELEDMEQGLRNVLGIV